MQALSPTIRPREVSFFPYGAACIQSTWVQRLGYWVTIFLVDAHLPLSPLLAGEEMMGSLAQDREVATVSKFWGATLALPPPPSSTPGAATIKRYRRAPLCS